MSLTTRLTAFFLLALALVLGGFSLTLYLLARSYLYRQLDERLQAAQNTLAAAAEVEDGAIEWEGHDRLLQVGGPFADSSVQWAVHGDAGQLISRSADLKDRDSLNHPIDLAHCVDGFLPTDALGEDRRCLQRRIQTDATIELPASEKPRYSTIVLTVAASEKPIHRLLERLAGALFITSVGVSAIGLLVGRWFCRRALKPVAQLTEQARTMNVDDRVEGLEIIASGDELQALGEAFNGLLHRLHEALARQRRFTGDASHQLRTPLAGLLGQVEVALRHPRTPEEYRRTLDQVHEQGRHLGRIVEMLLYLARADAEAKLDRPTPIDLAAWLPEHLQAWSEHPRRCDLQSILDCSSPITVDVHPQLFGQLLDNLLDNAFKYSEPGTPVVVRLGMVSGRAILSVEDRGDGLAEADLPHLFEPFFRSEAARKKGRPGDGLGLSVAQRIARLFGGSITARRGERGGSCFTVTLPLS